MIIKSQLSTTEPRKQKQKQTKQTTSTGSQKWRSPVGKGRGRMGGKVQGIRSIIGRHKIGRWRLIIV